MQSMFQHQMAAAFFQTDYKIPIRLIEQMFGNCQQNYIVERTRKNLLLRSKLNRCPRESENKGDIRKSGVLVHHVCEQSVKTMKSLIFWQLFPKESCNMVQLQLQNLKKAPLHEAKENIHGID